MNRTLVAAASKRSRPSWHEARAGIHEHPPVLNVSSPVARTDTVATSRVLAYVLCPEATSAILPGDVPWLLSGPHGP